MSKLVGQYIPNTSMDVVGLSVGDVIMKSMATKDLDLGIFDTIIFYEAANGIGTYANNMIPVRLLFAGQESVYQWFTLDPKIQTLADFKGRAIEYLTTGSAIKEYICNSTFEWLYNTYGFSARDVKALTWTSATKCNEDLLSGTADVGSTLAKAGAALLQLATQNSNFHLIPYPDAASNYIIQKYPALGKTIVPKGTYGKQPPADIQTIGSRNTIDARADLSDDLVYQIVKAVFDHLSDFQGILGPAVGADFTLQLAIANPTAPFHPGAIKYYKEKGVWTADLDKLQAAMLAKIGATR